MPTAKLAVTIDRALLSEVDRWIADGKYADRSSAIQAALEHLRSLRIPSSLLLRELSNLDPSEEKAMADGLLDSDFHD